MTNKIRKYFPYVLIYMCYYTNLPIKLEELAMIGFIIWSVLEKKIELKFNLKTIIAIGILGSISLIQSYRNNFSIDRVLEQILIISVMFIGYDLLFMKYGYKKLFKVYLKISYFICLLGILQFIIYLFLKIDILKFPLGCNIRLLTSVPNEIPRIRSIAYEPGWFSQTLIPAVIYSVEVLIRSKRFQKKYIIIIFAFAIARSSGAMIVIPLYFLLKKMNKIKSLIIVSIILPLIIYLTKNIWYGRVVDTISSLKKLDTGIFYGINASSFAILSNLYVALNNNSILFGVGLGNHPYSYFRNFIDRKIGVYHFYGLNSMDAYSLLSRMISEIGIIFSIFAILILIMNLDLKNNIKSTINVGAFLAIISFLIRGGLYTRFGTAFIIMLFFYTGKNARTRRKRGVQNGIGNFS
ncbi:MAG: hypothetical protein ACRCZ2_14260 [Fusobacteriaceae bacterium]